MQRSPLRGRGIFWRSLSHENSNAGGVTVAWLKVSPIGIILSAIAYILLGMVFYSHWILGRFWPDLVNHMQKRAEGIPAKVYLGAFMSAAMIAYAMGCFVKMTQGKTITSGIFIGFLIWAGVILPTIFSPVLFGKKPIQMFWLDAVYYLVAYIVLGAITAKFNFRLLDA